MEEIKVGDKLKIHCYKHNGKIYQASDEALVLDVQKDYIVCANFMTEISELEDTYTTKELAIIYFYKHNWFNCIAQLKSKGLYYYCNIASPYVIDDGIIKYIDYDLDLRVYPDGKFKILDRNEYLYHRKVLKYPPEINKIVNKELDKLIKYKKSNTGPFNIDEIKKYSEIYHNLSKK